MEKFYLKKFYLNDNYNDYNDVFQIHEEKESNQLKCSDYLRLTSDVYE